MPNAQPKFSKTGAAASYRSGFKKKTHRPPQLVLRTALLCGFIPSQTDRSPPPSGRHGASTIQQKTPTRGN
jgi:hypothetical protein